jgi:hypothetical protein
MGAAIQMKNLIPSSLRLAILIALPLIGFSQTSTPVGPEFAKGVMFGKISDMDGKPVVGATVALQGKNGKVIAWTKTDIQGEYALPEDPTIGLSLQPSHRRSLLENCIRSAADVAMVPIKVAADVVTKPGNTVKSAAESAASGSPTPITNQIASSVVPNKTATNDAAKNARAAAARAALEGGSTTVVASGQKGQAALLVSAAGFKEARVTVGAYWMEHPKVEKGKRPGMQAWLDTIQIAPVSGNKGASVVQQVLTLSNPIVEPTLAPAGSPIKIQVKLNIPPGPERRVRVFAREARKDIVVELTHQPGTDNIYAGTMTLDKKAPAGPTAISVGALRALPIEVNLDPKKVDPLQSFVARLDDMKAGHAYEYDPRIMASENRLDLNLTVLEPKKG